MARIYGVSDSELSFISFLNANLKEIEVNSFEEYQDYKDNYKEKRKEIEEDYDSEIKARIEKIAHCYNRIKQRNSDLRRIEWSIRRKEELIHKYPRKDQEKIEDQIANLKSKRRNILSSISDLREDIVNYGTKKDMLIMEKKETLFKFYKDINKLYELEKNEQFKMKRKGLVGENKVIDYISSNFKKEKNFNLINGLNFDVIGGGININNSTKLETQVDHVLICPKGVFFIETKHWNGDCTSDFRKKLIEQLSKIKQSISYIFEDKIDEDITKVILVGTEAKIDLKDASFDSLILPELKDYLLGKKDILTNSQIILILNEFIKYLPKDKFEYFPRKRIKINSWFISVKNLLKKKK